MRRIIFYTIFCIFFVLTKNIHGAQERTDSSRQKSRITQFLKKIKTQQLTSELLCACSAIKKPTTLTERTSARMPWAKKTPHEKRMATIAQLIVQGADVNMLLQDKIVDTSSGMRATIRHHYEYMVIGRFGSFDTNNPGYAGTALHAAVQSNSPELVQYLLASQADIHAQIPEKELSTDFRSASGWHDLFYVQMANVMSGYTPFMVAERIEKKLNNGLDLPPRGISSEDFFKREKKDNQKIRGMLEDAQEPFWDANNEVWHLHGQEPKHETYRRLAQKFYLKKRPTFIEKGTKNLANCSPLPAAVATLVIDYALPASLYETPQNNHQAKDEHEMKENV